MCTVISWSIGPIIADLTNLILIFNCYTNIVINLIKKQIIIQIKNN